MAGAIPGRIVERPDILIGPGEVAQSKKENPSAELPLRLRRRLKPFPEKTYRGHRLTDWLLGNSPAELRGVALQP